MSAPSVLLPACANWTPGSAPCEKLGNKVCTSCKLVVVSALSKQRCLSYTNIYQYCSADCQKAHWLEHKKYCKSPMSKDKWRPAWHCERRQPAWETDAAASNPHNPFGGGKYLWGNTPALDVLKLEQNEGLDYADDIALLFAGKSYVPVALYTLTHRSLGRFTPCCKNNCRYPRGDDSTV